MVVVPTVEVTTAKLLTERSSVWPELDGCFKYAPGFTPASSSPCEGEVSNSPKSSMEPDSTTVPEATVVDGMVHGG